MSVWGDIRKKSLGQEKRIEDANQEKYATKEQVNQILSGQKETISFVGRLSSNHIPKHEKGRIYYVEDRCTVGEKIFYPGSMVIDTGTEFEVISYDANDYIGTEYYTGV